MLTRHPSFLLAHFPKKNSGSTQFLFTTSMTPHWTASYFVSERLEPNQPRPPTVSPIPSVWAKVKITVARSLIVSESDVVVVATGESTEPIFAESI